MIDYQTTDRLVIKFPLLTNEKSSFEINTDHLLSFSFLLFEHMYSSQKLAIDLLISIFATFILSTTLLSISTANWYINITLHQRLGLFQQCSTTCTIKEFHRTITMFTLFAVILLTTSTLSAFLLMGTSIDRRNRCYLLVPIGLFGAGIAMTMAFIRIHERTSVNGYSALIFLIDTVLAYVLGGLSILHGSMFYF